MATTALKIRIFGDTALRKKSSSVKQVTQRERDILSSMARMMYENSGIGLAAPQIGIDEAMITVDIGSGLYKLINPRITRKEGRQAIEEGCLSIPGICIKVKRAREITLQAQDENGRQISIEAQDLFACVLQHEVDHLKGKLIVDYASFFERLKIKRKLAKLMPTPSPKEPGQRRKEGRDEKLPEPEAKSCQLQL